MTKFEKVVQSKKTLAHYLKVFVLCAGRCPIEHGLCWDRPELDCETKICWWLGYGNFKETNFDILTNSKNALSEYVSKLSHRSKKKILEDLNKEVDEDDEFRENNKI